MKRILPFIVLLVLGVALALLLRCQVDRKSRLPAVREERVFPNHVVPGKHVASFDTVTDTTDAVTASFDGDVDRWARNQAEATEDDVRMFVKRFNEIPSARKRDSLQRALNLIPDANVALLAGILFDRTQPRGIARAVFNDILNRTEQVKGPILRKVAADRTHPCHDDSVWLLGALGEVPNEN